MRTVCGSEFQTDGAENRKARLEKSVLMNGWSGKDRSMSVPLILNCLFIEMGTLKFYD